jgi:hypothetical protein
MNKQHQKSKEPSYIKLRAEMLCSPAWRALSLPERRIIERLIIEHCKHRGKCNGNLICTYQDFAEYGIRRPSIAAAIEQTARLGFVEVTYRGHRSPDHNWPSRYRLTFLATADGDATDDWKHFVAAKRPRKMQKPRYESVPSTGNENVPSTGYKNVPPGGQRDWVRKRNSYLDATHLHNVVAGSAGDAAAATPDATPPVVSTESVPSKEPAFARHRRKGWR